MAKSKYDKMIEDQAKKMATQIIENLDKETALVNAIEAKIKGKDLSKIEAISYEEQTGAIAVLDSARYNLVLNYISQNKPEQFKAMKKAHSEIAEGDIYIYSISFDWKNGLTINNTSWSELKKDFDY